MNDLKALLLKKKQQISTKQPVIIKDVEKERQERFLIEKASREKQKQADLIKRLNEIDEFYQSKKKHKTEDKSTMLPEAKINETSNFPPIPKQEIMQKLRQLNQPITLFAEDQWSRYRRWRKCEVQSMKLKENKILNDQEFKKKIKQDEQYQEIDAKYRNRLIQPRLMDDAAFRNRKKKMIQEDKITEVPMNQKYDEIMLWAKKVLKAWGQQLQRKYNTEQKKKSYQGKAAFEIFKSASTDLQPLFVVLRARGGDKENINALYHISTMCLIRQYIPATDKYIDMSIGNAPWPMGVCMLGITVKRNTPKLAHVLNQQLPRRWTLAIKRLIGVSQQMFPNEDDHKMVHYSVTKLI